MYGYLKAFCKLHIYIFGHLTFMPVSFYFFLQNQTVVATNICISADLTSITLCGNSDLIASHIKRQAKEENTLECFRVVRFSNVEEAVRTA